MPDARYRFTPAQQVNAGWLTCHRVRPGDAADIYASVHASRDHLRPWMPWVAGYSTGSAVEFVERQTAHGEHTPVSDAGYVVRDHAGRFLGLCGLHARLDEYCLEIGYWVDLRHTRRGIATLATAALTELAMGVPGLVRTEIHHDQANHASAAIPAALGYTHVATRPETRTAPGHSGIEWQWRMSRESWPASRGARLLAAARKAAG